MFVRFQDGAIHADRETEVVGIDDQAAHRASLAGTCGWMTGVPPVQPGGDAGLHNRDEGMATDRQTDYFLAALTFAHRAF